MILKAFQLILKQLSEYIEPISGPEEVVLGNIALAEAPNQNEIIDKIVISLVNIEEESTLKNAISYQKVFSCIKYVEPPIYLNLYVLISANYPQAYDTALRRLSSVIKFFQGRKTFNIKNARPVPDSLDINHPEEKSLSLSFELYTMTFEQINHLWGSLGGKQMPFVMYKIRLIEMIERAINREGRVIEEINNIANAENVT